VERLGYDRSMITLTLLEGRPEILYDLPARQRAKAVRRLQGMGVNLVMGEMLEEVTDLMARTSTGREIPARTLVWCGGAKADPDANAWGLEVDNSGRLVVETDHHIAGCPDVYAVGDVAAFKDPETNRVIPMLAQFAIRGAAHCAVNIVAEARGKGTTPFHPHMHGEFVSVGPRWGVGWMFKLPVSGWFAIVMKRITYIMYWLQVGTFRLAYRRTIQMMRMHRY
jgi:NADH:ubiquinone reductase (H+-translocating)